MVITELHGTSIPPYGGKLAHLLAPEAEYLDLFETALRLPGVQISTRAQYDLELLAVGAFSPLEAFMGHADYQRVLTEMRLADGTLFPLPVTLPVDEAALLGHESVALTDARRTPLALLDIEEMFAYDPLREARLALGTTDPEHPLVAEMAGWGKVCVSGRLRVLGLPRHCQFGELALTPAQTRQRLALMGFDRVVAFQTRNPMHRIHEELTKRSAEAVGGALLIHPVVGLTRPGDVATQDRVCSYMVLVERYFDPDSTLLSLLPLAMRLAGPREALLHAIIRRNYGATHLIIGRDHAGPGKNHQGTPFYGAYEAQAMLEQYAAEIGVQPVEYKELVYLADEHRYEEAAKAPPGARIFSISGTQVREDYLAKGVRLPEWFTRPEVAEILQGTKESA
jgi:sulfate adenylyltransferase